MTEFKIRRLNAQDINFPARLEHLLAWHELSDATIHERVREIIARVRIEGDAALIDYTARFDRYPMADAGELELPRQWLKTAWEGLPQAQAAALESASERIRVHAEQQKLSSWRHTETDGTVLGQQVTPLDRVGVYVPGGN